MRRTILAVLTILMLALGAGAAQADMYVGVYGGYSLLQDEDITVAVGPLSATGEVEFDSGPTVGGKAGYWLKTLPWVAVEFNVWNTWAGVDKVAGSSVSDIDLTLLNFSGSVLLQYLSGPLRVYAGGGVLGTWAEFSNGDSVDDTAIGALGQGGVEYEVVPHWTVFGEYRYTWNSFEFEEAGAKMEMDLGRHEFLGGVNFRF